MPFAPLAIRLGLLLGVAVSSASCVDSPASDPDRRYGGPVPPCDVTLSKGEVTPWFNDVAPDKPLRFWEPGPYPTWNTTPSWHCGEDPTIATVDLSGLGQDTLTDVAIHLTYPAATRPSVTGDGRVAEGRFPVIVFAHANSDRKCEIYRDYFSLHDHWASWGFVVASVDASTANCQSGNSANIRAREAGMLAALDRLAELDAAPESRFHGRLDLSRVVWAGHSRGGGAALLAALSRPEVTRGVIDLQGIDLTAYGFGDPPLPFPALGVTAGEDRDLPYPYVDLTADSLDGPYSWVTINGGIHAYTADHVPLEKDDVPLLRREQQHDITEFYTTAFLARFVGVPASGDQGRRGAHGASRVLFSHEGARIVDGKITFRGVYNRWNAREPDALLIDTFDGASDDAIDRNLLGGANRCAELIRCDEVATYRPEETTVRGAYGKAYSRLLGGEGSFLAFLRPDESPRTIARSWTIQGRVKGPDEGEVAEFEVLLRTPDATYGVPGNAYVGPEPLSNRFTQLVVPLEQFRVDGGDAAEFEVVAVGILTHGGQLFIDDLRLTPPPTSAP